MSARVKVLVADDSAFMRKMISEILAQDPLIEVVGTARDGVDVIRKVVQLRPDVVTLDVEMPVMDGLEALKQIMRDCPTPVVMVSSMTQAGAEATIQCLEAGALDFVGKPSGSISLDIHKVGHEIAEKVKIVARVQPSCFVPSSRPAVRPAMGVTAARQPKVLVVGASTGGPRALQALLPAIPGDLGLAMVVVQHMPPGFTGALARRLDEACAYDVREASDGDRLQPGLALVARGGQHLEFGMDGVARLSEAPAVHNVRPSVDVTIASLIQAFGGRTMAVLLTGMGEDGARGLKAVRSLGGTTFAEDASTCVVYGMPKAAVEMDGVDHVLPLDCLASGITESVRGRPIARVA